VRVDVARNFHEGLQCLGRQRGRVGGPRVLDADPGAGRNGDDRNRGGSALQKDSAAVFASTINFSHGLSSIERFVDCTLSLF